MKTWITILTILILTTLNATAKVVEIDSLASCLDSTQTKVEIDSLTPVAILVHGVHAGKDGFSPMAKAISKLNITPICFRYNDINEKIHT